MSESKTNQLIIGIGNAGRQDDGLGWAFLDAIREAVGDTATLEYRYQLNIEDAELISSASSVLFVDARTGSNSSYEYRECLPRESYQFTSHALEPEVIVSLCHSLYQAIPEAHLLTISGEQWELKEGLSEQAKKNLKLAVEYYLEKVLGGELEMEEVSSE